MALIALNAISKVYQMGQIEVHALRGVSLEVERGVSKLVSVAAAPWPLAVAVTGWQLKVSAQATDFTIAVGASLLFIAIQFYWLRVFRLICMPDGLAAALFRWPEPSLRLLRSELQRLSLIVLPAMVSASMS